MEMPHVGIDQRLARHDLVFVVPTRPALPAPLREGALDDPAVRLDGEDSFGPSVGAFADLDLPARRSRNSSARGPLYPASAQTLLRRGSVSPETSSAWTTSRAPLVAAAHTIQHGVDDLAPTLTRRASGQLDGGHRRLQSGPFALAQVTRIRLADWRYGRCCLFHASNQSHLLIFQNGF
jgi:hypothetical protein